MGSWEDFDRLTRFIGHNPEEDISRLVCGTIAFTLAFVLIVQIPSLRLMSGESVARRLLLFAVQTFSIYTFLPELCFGIYVVLTIIQNFESSHRGNSTGRKCESSGQTALLLLALFRYIL